MIIPLSHIPEKIACLKLLFASLVLVYACNIYFNLRLNLFNLLIRKDQEEIARIHRRTRQERP